MRPGQQGSRGECVEMRLGCLGERSCSLSLLAALLLMLWARSAGAQEPIPPTPDSSPTVGAGASAASSPASSVEERLQRLEATNQQLLRQNQELTQQLRSVMGRLNGGPAASPSDTRGSGGNQPSAGSAAGGGDLMAPALGGPADRSAGANADTFTSVPSRGASFGGGDLISFDPNDPEDANGVKMYGRFGRRFINNGLWFESPDKVFQFHVGGRDQMDAAFFSAGNPVQFGPNGIGKLRDGVNARRMRIRFEGAMWENMLFCAEFDFINSSIPQGTPGAGPLTSVSNTPA